MDIIQTHNFEWFEINISFKQTSLPLFHIYINEFSFHLKYFENNSLSFSSDFSQYLKTTPENLLVDTSTEQLCVAYATFHSKSSSFVYRYRMKDVDCNTKAAFICRYNPGLNINIYFFHLIHCDSPYLFSLL